MLHIEVKEIKVQKIKINVLTTDQLLLINWNL